MARNPKAIGHCQMRGHLTVNDFQYLISNADTKYDSSLCQNNKWVWETQTFAPVFCNTSHGHITFSNHPNVVQVLLKICYQCRKCSYPLSKRILKNGSVYSTCYSPAGCSEDFDETVTEGSTWYLASTNYHHCHSGTREGNEAIYFLQAHGSVQNHGLQLLTAKLTQGQDVFPQAAEVKPFSSI